MSAEKFATDAVYVVDDDPSVLRSIGRLLNSEGVKVRTFDEPNRFLESSESESVPVVTLDVWMQNMTGLELQSKLLRRSPKTRVIIMTGRNDPGVKQTALKMGASAYLVSLSATWSLSIRFGPRPPRTCKEREGDKLLWTRRSVPIIPQPTQR